MEIVACFGLVCPHRVHAGFAESAYVGQIESGKAMPGLGWEFCRVLLKLEFQTWARVVVEGMKPDSSHCSGAADGLGVVEHVAASVALELEQTEEWVECRPECRSEPEIEDIGWIRLRNKLVYRLQVILEATVPVGRIW